MGHSTAKRERVHAYRETHPTATYREIQAALGFGSVSCVYRALRVRSRAVLLKDNERLRVVLKLVEQHLEPVSQTPLAARVRSVLDETNPNRFPRLTKKSQPKTTEGTSP